MPSSSGRPATTFTRWPASPSPAPPDLGSSFHPTYNLAVNLVRRWIREEAHEPAGRLLRAVAGPLGIGLPPGPARPAAGRPRARGYVDGWRLTDAGAALAAHLPRVGLWWPRRWGRGSSTALSPPAWPGWSPASPSRPGARPRTNRPAPEGPDQRRAAGRPRRDAGPGAAGRGAPATACARTRRPRPRGWPGRSPGGRGRRAALLGVAGRTGRGGPGRLRPQRPAADRPGPPVGPGGAVAADSRGGRAAVALLRAGGGGGRRPGRGGSSATDPVSRP